MSTEQVTTSFDEEEVTQEELAEEQVGLLKGEKSEGSALRPRLAAAPEGLPVPEALPKARRGLDPAHGRGRRWSRSPSRGRSHS